MTLSMVQVSGPWELTPRRKNTKANRLKPRAKKSNFQCLLTSSLSNRINPRSKTSTISIVTISNKIKTQMKNLCVTMALKLSSKTSQNFHRPSSQNFRAQAKRVKITYAISKTTTVVHPPRTKQDDMQHKGSNSK